MSVAHYTVIVFQISKFFNVKWYRTIKEINTLEIGQHDETDFVEE